MTYTLHSTCYYNVTMRKWWNNFWFSFPVQLLILHVRNHILLTSIWVFLGSLITGSVANMFGVKYLFWSPEYFGEVSFWSFFFLGFCFGGFVMTWHLSVYMLSAQHFPFLATLSKPFTKFCINNFIIPLFFVFLILHQHIHFLIDEHQFSWGAVIYHVSGFIFGLLSLIILLIAYFTYTNRDILSYSDSTAPTRKGFLKRIAPGRRVNLEEIRSEVKSRRVETYLTEGLRPRMVRSVSHYSLQVIMNVFKQNHTNALIVQMSSMLLLVALGFGIEYPSFRIPAGASVFLFLSVVVASIGAFLYWFNHWSFTVILLLFFVVNTLTKRSFFNHENRAYGLSYQQPRPVYEYAKLQGFLSTAQVNEDKDSTIRILHRWKARTGEIKPKMIFVCVSGGGLKSATWAMQVLQNADSLTHGSLMRHTVLMSGASGGMIGMSYFRELYYLNLLGESVNPYNVEHIYKVSKDLLNPIAFTITTNDIFIPKGYFKVGDQQYRKDRGYIFEQQLNENTDWRLNRTLGEYKEPERLALIPMLFITPYIVNDARRVIISPHPVSYMAIAPNSLEAESCDVDAIDFMRFFGNQSPEKLLFTSALRMNATYPYILPSVTLPTSPDIEVMDAGFRDNFGLKSTVRFLTVFKDWIDEHTSGVIILSIRGIERNSEVIDATDNDGIVKSLVDPLGIAGKIVTLQDYENDSSIGLLRSWFGPDRFEVIPFVYKPTTRHEEASMTFHLTLRERDDILNAITLPQNQGSLNKLKQHFLMRQASGMD